MPPIYVIWGFASEFQPQPNHGTQLIRLLTRGSRSLTCALRRLDGLSGRLATTARSLRPLHSLCLSQFVHALVEQGTYVLFASLALILSFGVRIMRME